MDKSTNIEARAKAVIRQLGDLIRVTRNNNGLSMNEVAKKSGVSSSVISDLENYKGIMPNILTLMKIANGLELPEEIFIEKIWNSMTRRNNDKEQNVLNRLKSALNEYGVPPICINRVLDYINYYKSLEEIEKNYKVINAIYEYEIKNGVKISNIMLDPTLIIEAKMNIERIENIKNNL